MIEEWPKLPIDSSLSLYRYKAFNNILVEDTHRGYVVAFLSKAILFDFFRDILKFLLLLLLLCGLIKRHAQRLQRVTASL